MSYNLEQIDPDQRTGFYEEPSDEEPPSPRRVLKTVVALVVMGLFAGGLWFAYVEGARHPGRTGDSGDIPLIRADTRPMKVKPAEAGGMHIPDRNMLIYGQGRPEVEHLLPPPEQPMALPAPAPPTSGAVSASQAAASDSPPAASGSPPAPPIPVVQPARPSAALPPVVAEPGPAPARGEVSGDLPANPHREPAKSPATRPDPGKAAGVRLQIASVRSEGVAREEWDRIKRMNPDLLGHLTAVAIRADLGDKGVYYRIQTGPVGDASAAERLCGELRQRHLGCIMVR